MPSSELLPMRPHFFDDWIITHHLHPLVLPVQYATHRGRCLPDSICCQERKRQ